MARPKEFDGTISVRLTSDLHDRLCLESVRMDMELSKVIRERLRVSYLKTPQINKD